MFRRALSVALISLIAVHSGALESTLTFSVTKASLRFEESDGSVARDIPLAPYALLQDQLRLENSQTLKVLFTKRVMNVPRSSGHQCWPLHRWF